MNELVVKIENKDGINVVSSRTVAIQLGKEHNKVIRTLEQMLEKPNVASLIIPSFYEVEGQKRKYKEYLLTKDGFVLYMFNIQGFNDFKLAYINKFNEMERIVVENKILPQNYLEALEALIISEKEKQKLLLEYKPIKSYVEEILSSDKNMRISQIAADYGLSGIKLNKILHEEKFIRKISEQWILYKKYMNLGYTKSSTIINEGKVYVNTLWTQKGRLKIHEILTELGYKANVDMEGE